MKLFGQDVLNIFCDASIMKLENETIGCPGSVVIGPSTDIVDGSIQLLRQSSNNNAEITAILMALQQALKFRSDFPIINIFSDSKISVYGLREWMFNWARSIKDGVLYSSSGEPVANQQIFLHIVRLVVSTNLNVNLYHQKGHVSDRNLLPAKQLFLESNGILISDDEAIYISKYNNYIDILTKQELQKVDINALFPQLSNPLLYGLDKSVLPDFKSLIRPN